MSVGTSLKTFWTSLEYVAGALQSPNGSLANSYSPLGVLNAVFSRSSGRMLTTW